MPFISFVVHFGGLNRNIYNTKQQDINTSLWTIFFPSLLPEIFFFFFFFWWRKANFFSVVHFYFTFFMWHKVKKEFAFCLFLLSLMRGNFRIVLGFLIFILYSWCDFLWSLRLQLLAEVCMIIFFDFSIVWSILA